MAVRYKEIVNDTRWKIVFISGFVWSLAAHAMMFSNQLSLHDEVAAFNNYGTTYKLGRWSLGLMGEYSSKLWGTYNVSIHTFYGVLTIISLLLTVYLLVVSLDIKKNSSIIILTGLFVTFPAVTDIFSYMYTAWPYYLGVLFGEIGAVIWFRRKTIGSFVLATMLMAFGTGFYQANIPVYIATLVLFLMIEVSNEQLTWKEYIQKVLLNIFACFAFMVEYYVANLYFVKARNVDVDSRMTNALTTGVAEYLKRVVIAYQEFVRPTVGYSGGERYILGITGTSTNVC